MQFESFKKVYDPIVLPIAGRDGQERLYTIPAARTEVVVKFRLSVSPGSDVTMTDEDTFQGFLGDAYQQMLDDGVPAEAVGRALFTAVADIDAGRDAALIAWETGGSPKAIRAWSARNSPSTTSTVEAKKTRSPASTSGTKPRQKN